MSLRAALLLIAWCAFAEDWPEWRGRGRTGVWLETEIVDQLPPEGLRVRWQAPVRGGYAGPAVAGGRVFVTDYAEGIERLLAFDERSGSRLWKHQWPADYRGLDYATGPRATPTVDMDRVYALGAKGALRCVDSRTGRLLWERDYVRDFA